MCSQKQWSRIMGASLVFLVFTVAGILFYLVPTLVAHNRKHHNLGAIFALNLLLGWTLVGWVAALVWALTRPAPAPGAPE